MSKTSKSKVVDLGKEKQKRLVLDAFDKLENKGKRERTEQKKLVEREARKRF